MLPQTLLLDLGELAVVIVFALVAIWAKALDRGGFLASVAVGFAIFLGGGWRWFVIIASFFILGVGFTWYKYEGKKRIGGAQEKGGARSWPNILANGGLAALFGLGELAFGGPAFAVLYLGAMSAAGADTVATELGLLNKTPPRLITHPQSTVQPGTSGGVSKYGFLGSLLAAAAIGIIAALLAVPGRLSPVVILAAAVSGGVVGSIADSFVGATLQRKGACTVCGAPTENLVHCGKPTARRSGVGFVDNNVVNVIATVVGALVSLAVAAAFL